MGQQIQTIVDACHHYIGLLQRFPSQPLRPQNGHS